ncbi:oxygenase MpaB family protein [Actinotalea sp. JY-7876]|uniref:oxygenase MpaB family protein n=2 Tax=unclassified Actinotalea TaxID=2638618 RepID=UPI00210242C5|nr:oxygenase MpaB family protein [Actinotalea sp. JY-7876]
MTIDTMTTSAAPSTPSPTGGVERLRAAAAGAVLRRVAGPDPAQARARVHAAPGPRWFDPDSPIGRVHGDASMFVGGIRALLLQSLHPRAMAAVAAHSGYRGDPWGRLQRTATFLATTTFGPAEDAARAVAIVRAVHARVSGTTSQGEPYEASDPHLVRWVHLAEVDSFLLAHQRLGARPLSDEECDEYVAQVAVVGHALGAAPLPTTLAGLHEALGAYRPELRGTTEAREAAAFLLRTPPLPAPARPVYGLLAAGGVALMPAWTRSELGLRYRPRVDAALGRPGGRVATRAIRWALSSVPPARLDHPEVVPPAGPDRAGALR